MTTHAHPNANLHHTTTQQNSTEPKETNIMTQQTTRVTPTTEQRLNSIRARMTDYPPSRTAVRREQPTNNSVGGWYYTEPVYPLSIGV